MGSTCYGNAASAYPAGFALPQNIDDRDGGSRVRTGGRA